jgi:hypothetical protein
MTNREDLSILHGSRLNRVVGEPGEEVASRNATE